MAEWGVQDDALLRDAVEGGLSLAAMAAGAVTFSQPFTEEQLTARWRALLYDPAVSCAAVARWQGVAAPAQPPPPSCPDILTLLGEWRRTKRAEREAAIAAAAEVEAKAAAEAAAAAGPLVAPGAPGAGFAVAGAAGPAQPPVQAAPLPPPVKADDAPATFSEVDEALLELPPRALLALGATWSERGARVRERAGRRHDAALLQSLERGLRASTKRGAEGALAALRGLNTRFLVTKKEVLLGRSTGEQLVDLDLALEGNASKVSRQHAFIQLRRDGRFYIRNVGRRPLMVNNVEVRTGVRAHLPADCLLDIGGLRLLFSPFTPPLADEAAGKEATAV